jgi:hypothetical protein
MDHEAPADEKARWYAEGARQFVIDAARSQAARLPKDVSRAKPLLALPVVGTGKGGGSKEAGIVLRELMRVLLDVVEQVEADVVLVTHTPDQFAAAQQARRDVSASTDSMTLWGDLTDRERQVGKNLASLGVNGQLVLFLGAGVSVSAGLPTWSQLLAGLAEDATFNDAEKTALG